MNSSQFIRDKAKVDAAITEDGAGAVIAVKPVKVYIPARYKQSDMAVFETEKTFVGICALVVEDKYYAVSCVTSFMRTEPATINNVTIDDNEYIEMSYEPGDKIITNINLVVVDSLLYRIYDEFIAKGRVPWFLGYEDIGNLFVNSGYYNGVTIGSNPQIFEMIVAAICRAPDSIRNHYRQKVLSKEELKTNPPVIVPLRAVSMGATNAIAKLMGPYFDDNVTSTLVNPGERVERVERLLRT